MNTRNYGLIVTEKDPTGYILGGGLVPFEILQEDKDWTPFLPVKEVQNLNGIEPYACVSFTILNAIEILIKRKYGLTRNYSDRFLAFVSGTPELMGNDPHAVCEFLRKIGVVPEEIWPFDSTIQSFKDFYAPIPPKLYELAREFNEEWLFMHEYVSSVAEDISKALKSSPLLISVPAWFKDGDGYHYRPGSMMDNHATTLIYERIGAFRRVFDTYDTPVLKDVRWDCMPMIIKRFHIEKRVHDVPVIQPVIPVPTKPKESLWKRLVAWFWRKVTLFKKYYDEQKQGQ